MKGAKGGQVMANIIKVGIRNYVNLDNVKSFTDLGDGRWRLVVTDKSYFDVTDDFNDAVFQYLAENSFKYEGRKKDGES